MPTASPSTTLSYLGHATVMVNCQGLNILTDPVFGDRVLHLRRRTVSASRWLAEQPAPDVIALSHLHLDHLHLPSLRRLPKNIPMLVPKGTARWLKALIAQDLVELAPDESIAFDGVEIVATAALHGNPRRNAVFDQAQGYLFRSEHTIYFPGDTDVFPAMAELGDLGLDLALMPIWGWGPTLGKGHLDPERAVEALKLLRPRLAIPIHWATFRPMGFFWEYLNYLSQPGPEFQRLAAALAPVTRVQMLAPGERFVLD